VLLLSVKILEHLISTKGVAVQNQVKQNWKNQLTKKIVATSVCASLAFTPSIGNACTSFLLKGNDNGYVYGRTIEFGLALQSQLTLIPKNTAMQGVGVDSKPGTILN
jgi:choloylglycine hydrolase